MTLAHKRFARHSPRVSNNDTRIALTAVASVFDNKRMPGFADFHQALRVQYNDSKARVASINKELTELRSSYMRYKDLSVDQQAAEERLRVLIGILANVMDEPEPPLDVDPGISIESAIDEREKTPLWKVIREFTRSVAEIRIIELESQLQTYGYKVSRQAIESAINTHKDVFRSTRKGRERFVSLK